MNSEITSYIGTHLMSSTYSNRNSQVSTYLLCIACLAWFWPRVSAGRHRPFLRAFFLEEESRQLSATLRNYVSPGNIWQAVDRTSEAGVDEQY
jgi:hypothetical protein